MVDVVDGLSTEEKARLLADAAYMVARGLRGEMDFPAPAHWSAEKIASFDAVIATEEGRSALLAAALRGWQRNAQRGQAAQP